MAEIPAIPIDDSVPPFPVNQPEHYFRNWLKQTFRAGLRRLRLSG